MIGKFFRKLIKFFFQLRLDAVIDIFKEQYESRKILLLKKKLKSSGNNFFIGGKFDIKNPQYISIGNYFTSLYNLRIEAWDEYMEQKFFPEIIIGSNVNFNTDCHISCIYKVEIGNNVLMASRIYISDHSHGEINAAALQLPPSKRPLISKGAVIIKDNVWVGENVCILPGVVIGANSIIGANAVVTTDVPPNSVVGGIPAKIIRAL